MQCCAHPDDPPSSTPSLPFHLSAPPKFCIEDIPEVLDPAALQRLLDMAYRSTSSFAVVYMVNARPRFY